VVRNAAGHVWTIPQSYLEAGNVERIEAENFCAPADVSPYFATKQELNAHAAHCSGRLWIGGTDYECAMCAESERRRKSEESLASFFDFKPVNRPVKYIIKAKLSDDEKNKALAVGLGAVTAWVNASEAPKGWMECDGRSLSKKDYVDLYAAVGDQFCPPHVERLEPEPGLITKLREIFPALSKRYPRKKKMVPNPMWREGHFHIPDLRGCLPRLPPKPDTDQNEAESNSQDTTKDNGVAMPYKAGSTSYSSTMNGYD